MPGNPNVHDDYDGFIEKFKPKRTTDDCYTPEIVYNAVADYVAKKYNRSKGEFLRPFWPGGDYESAEYPEGCTVVDNPPFSILSKIVQFYQRKAIPFFLFCPGIANGSLSRYATLIIQNVAIEYENGAVVGTSFITNLEDPETMAMSDPDLYAAVNAANIKARRERKGELPKYQYPPNITYAPELYDFSKNGIVYKLKRADAVGINRLDAQQPSRKTIFGKGYLLSSRALTEIEEARKANKEAKKRKAAEAADEDEERIIWQLSDREKEIIAKLDNPEE